jgi:hypothetical protein
MVLNLVFANADLLNGFSDRFRLESLRMKLRSGPKRAS